MGYFIFIFPLLIIGMLALISFIISKMGWDDLYANYPASTEFSGQRIGIITAAVNNANYKNSLVLKYNEEGIYLRPVLIFRLFHKPILIPWKEIKEVRQKKILIFSYTELIIGNPFVAVIKISKSTFTKLEYLISQRTTNFNRTLNQ
ncbi:MAG: hypothetical protein ABI480_17115 [Chitinophagaceae bacterium]